MGICIISYEKGQKQNLHCAHHHVIVTMTCITFQSGPSLNPFEIGISLLESMIQSAYMKDMLTLFTLSLCSSPCWQWVHIALMGFVMLLSRSLKCPPHWHRVYIDCPYKVHWQQAVIAIWEIWGVLYSTSCSPWGTFTYNKTTVIYVY